MKADGSDRVEEGHAGPEPSRPSSTASTAWGSGRPTIQERRRADAEFELVVELPGVDDPARVRGSCRRRRWLELCSVKGGPYSSRDDALPRTAGSAPGLEAGPGERAAGRKATGEIWYLLGRTAVVTGRDLRNARPSRGELGRWKPDFVAGQGWFPAVQPASRSQYRQRLAIVLDNQVRSAPTIQNRIEDSGLNQARRERAGRLGPGAGAAGGSLRRESNTPEERTVGPRWARTRSGRADRSMVGLGAVILAMLIYYKGAGVNAVLALALNTVTCCCAELCRGGDGPCPGSPG